MQSEATIELGIPGVPPATKKAHVFKDVKKALLSIPQLCDAGCFVHFSNKDVTVTNNSNVVMMKGT